MTAEAPVHIVPSDARWPDEFECERVRLLDAIGGWLAGPIEHISSTAVPGLAAKPVIDILAAGDGPQASFPALPALSGQ